MSEDTNQNSAGDNAVEEVIDNLDDFSADFFNNNKKPVKEEKVEEKPEPQADANKDVDAGADDTPAPEDDPDEEGVEEGEQPDDSKPAPKKNRFQERIDELTNARREAERREAALLERLAKLEQPAEKPAPLVNQVGDTGPLPDAMNEDGTEKYPLGEFDPQYIRDLTRHALNEERERFKREENQARQQSEANEAKEQLQQSWVEKLGPAQERYPDFQEKGQTLIASFEGIDPAYGEYLTSTLMAMDHGPDVLYYLANNPDEANSIVKSGAARATLSLGRLEARFEKESEAPKPVVKTSKAPTPPPHLNKGVSVSRDTPPDTDDLDAFADTFFNKRKR